MFENLPSFNEVFRTFEDPNRLHAIMVHLPIAAAVIGFILTLGVALTGSKASGLRWTTIFIYMLGVLAALWTVQTGEDAEAHLDPKPSTLVADVLTKHKELAEFFWVGLATAGALILISTLRITWLRSISLLLAVVVSAASVAWVAAIGHFGGELVYVHEVGVGQEHTHTPPPPPTNGDKDKTDKDAGEKDKQPEPPKDKDKEKVEPPAVKDKAEEKDKNGERKLPEPTGKDKNIFDP